MTQKLTIIIDLDGTLVDTAPDLMGAHNHVMKKFGLHQKDLGDIKHLAGRGAWIMMQRSFKEEIKDEKTTTSIMKIIPKKTQKGIEKITIKNTTIIIKTKSPSWRQEIEFMKKEIIKKIDKNFRNYGVDKITIL